MNKRWPYTSFGIPDELFIRGKVPMTKEEVRSVVLAKLRLKKDSILVDVGAGTGSVSIEAALHCTEGRIYSIEYKEEALQLIEENKKVFDVDNIDIINGRGGVALKNIVKFDRIFIGGSEGELPQIIEIAEAKLSALGRIVIATVTVESLYVALKELEKRNFHTIEAVTVGVAKGRSTGRYTLMEAQNSVSIISAEKGRA